MRRRPEQTEDDLSSFEPMCSTDLSPAVIRVRLRRIDFVEEKTRLKVRIEGKKRGETSERRTDLRSTCFGHDVTRHWKAILKNFCRIAYGRLKQLFETLVFGKIVITSFDPLSDGFAMVDQYVIESIHEKNSIRQDTAAVE